MFEKNRLTNLTIKIFLAGLLLASGCGFRDTSSQTTNNASRQEESEISGSEMEANECSELIFPTGDLPEGYELGDYSEIAETEESATQRIERFTRNYFRFLESIDIERREDNLEIAISFIPVVGSYPIKEDIYRSVAYHALQVSEFFPEVERFTYTVLWDDYTKQSVLTLSLDESAIKNLEEVYYTQLINENGGFPTAFKDAFSSIEETDESQTWR